MNLERRLHHAARELRELEIEPPGLPVDGPPKRSLVAAVGPLVGASFAIVLGIAVLRSPSTDPEPDAAPATAAPVVVVVADPIGLPTPVQELTLIRALTSGRSLGGSAAGPATAAPAVRAPAGVS